LFNDRGGPTRSRRTQYITQIGYARRIVGHKYYPFMNYQMPPHVYQDANPSPPASTRLPASRRLRLVQTHCIAVPRISVIRLGTPRECCPERSGPSAPTQPFVVCLVKGIGEDADLRIGPRSSATFGVDTVSGSF